MTSGSPSQLKQQLGVDSIKITLKDCAKDKKQAIDLLKSLTGVSNIKESGDCLTDYAKNTSQLIADIVRALDSLEIRLSGISFSPPLLMTYIYKRLEKELDQKN